MRALPCCCCCCRSRCRWCCRWAVTAPNNKKYIMDSKPPGPSPACCCCCSSSWSWSWQRGPNEAGSENKHLRGTHVVVAVASRRRCWAIRFVQSVHSFVHSLSHALSLSCSLSCWVSLVCFTRRFVRSSLVLLFAPRSPALSSAAVASDFSQFVFSRCAVNFVRSTRAKDVRDTH